MSTKGAQPITGSWIDVGKGAGVGIAVGAGNWSASTSWKLGARQHPRANNCAKG